MYMPLEESQGAQRLLTVKSGVPGTKDLFKK